MKTTEASLQGQLSLISQLKILLLLETLALTVLANAKTSASV